VRIGGPDFCEIGLSCYFMSPFKLSEQVVRYC